MTRHLYAHIPFCRAKCAYCDFTSEAVGPHLRADRLEEYTAALLSELAEEDWGDSRTFVTIYVGGGTPSVLPSDILLPLVDRLAARLSAGGEFTIEANPGTVDALLLTRLGESGVTRLSLGIQSFSDEALAALGRRGRSSEAAAAVEAVREAGWQEWNLDLVFGIPGQTWAQSLADLDAAVDAAPPHLSLYDLTYTSAYARWVEERLGAGARGAAGAAAEEHYAEAVGRLEAAGYRRYEVSNFALPGHECRHNQAYWRGEDYLGLGASAVSTMGACRRTNPATVADYLVGRPALIEQLDPETRLWEKAMLGLRTSEGVDEREVAPVLEREALERLLGQGCLERRCGRLRLNAGYLDVSNSVLAALLVSPGGS